MAKKIRFPLEMDDGIEVRTMDELREHFAISPVLAYLENGKLLTWLRDRYEDDLADALESLDLRDTELAANVCKIFEVEVDLSAAEDMEAIQERNRKIELLKEAAADEKFFDLVDQIAFTQDELYDLLDDGQTTIYLCGESFSIPLGKKGIAYVGINQPVAKIASKTVVDWAEKKITLTNIQFDETYQQMLKSETMEQNLLGTSGNPTVQKKYYIVQAEQAECSFLLAAIYNRDKRMVDTLIEVNESTGEETIIDIYVSDYFDIGDAIIYVKNDFGHRVYRYEKVSTSKLELSVELTDITTTSRMAIGSTKIWPHERSVCANKNKIVYWSDWQAFVINHDGTNKQLLSVCGDPMTPITLHNNSFYYLNRDRRRKNNNNQLCCYDLISRENKKFAEEAWTAAYYKDKLYYVALEGKMENATRRWKIYELNMQSQALECIYTSSSCTGTPSTLYIENGRLGYKDNFGEDQGYIKAID